LGTALGDQKTCVPISGNAIDGLQCLPFRWRLWLQPFDRVPDEHPHGAAVHIAVSYKRTSTSDRLEQGVIAVPLHDGHCGMSDVDVRDQPNTAGMASAFACSPYARRTKKAVPQNATAPSASSMTAMKQSSASEALAVSGTGSKCESAKRA